MANYDSKKWYTSKTLWTNVCVVIAGVATGISADLAAGVTITTVGVINIVLRVITSREVTL